MAVDSVWAVVVVGSDGVVLFSILIDKFVQLLDKSIFWTRKATRMVI